KIVPDDINEIKATLCSWTDVLGVDLIISVGGTSFQPRAVMPEATRAVIEKEATVLQTAIHLQCLKENPISLLYRGVAGIRKKTLIINLPENVQSAAACLEKISLILPIAIGQMKGEKTTDKVIENLLSKQKQFPDKTKDFNLPFTPQSTPENLPVIRENRLDSGSVVLPSLDLNQSDFGGSHSTPITVDSHQISVNAHSQIDTHNIAIDTHQISVADHHTPIIDHHTPIVDHHTPIVDHHTAITEHHTAVDEHHALDSQNDHDLARRNRIYPYPPVSLEKAFGLVVSNTDSTPVTVVQLKDSPNYTLAEDVLANESVPPLPTSILDGYAVIAADTPGNLEVINSKSSDVLLQYVTPGRCVRVSTGSLLPSGADSVVKVEDTTILREAADGNCELVVRVNTTVKSGDLIRANGSDLKRGEVVLKAGTKLKHIAIGMLAAAGVSKIRVHKLPVIAVLSIGDKLVEPDKESLRVDEIRDTNRLTLLLLLKQQGFPTMDYGTLTGDRARIKSTLVSAYQNGLSKIASDLVISTGGCSMGEKDIVKSVIQEIGGTLQFGRVAIKPGAPACFATLNTGSSKKLFFCLPGARVPVPALTAYYLLVKPCLQKLCGSKSVAPTVVKARVSTDIELGPGPEYQRAALRYEPNEVVPYADVTGNQIISRLQSMADAKLLLLLPAATPTLPSIRRGQVVDAVLM
uniref:molybdopterin adenylyltransferase n=1 Tax=Ciona savignyi TaxID=51511 RepID=H2Z0L5_CIOSA